MLSAPGLCFQPQPARQWWPRLKAAGKALLVSTSWTVYDVQIMNPQAATLSHGFSQPNLSPKIFPSYPVSPSSPNPFIGHCSVLVPRLTSSFRSLPAQTFTLTISYSSSKNRFHFFAKLNIQAKSSQNCRHVKDDHILAFPSQLVFCSQLILGLSANEGYEE